MREHWLNIAKNWNEFHALVMDDKNHAMHKLVVKTIPQELRDIAEDRQFLKIKGSVGQSRITMTPWFATMDERITTSAEDGYYLVYLLNKELDTLFLSFGVGANQFNKKLKGILKKSERLERKQQVVAQIRSLIEHKIPNPIKQNMVIGTMPLSASDEDKAHAEYQDAGVLAFKYDINNLPSDEKLRSDYLLFLDFYQDVVTDPIMPSMDELIISTYKDKAKDKTITIIIEPFQKREAPKRRSKTQHFAGGDSKDAKRIGDIAEKHVLNHEKERLINAGRSDLADKVIHEEAEKNRPGWDITSFDLDGTEIYIEVKGSSSDKINAVIITANEWQAAQHPNHRDNYYLYLVRKALTSKPVIEKLQNPAKWVSDEEFQIEPSQYNLKLYK